MSGSWELGSQKSVLVGILHVETVTIAWAFGLRNLIVPSPHPFPFIPLTGMPYDHGRNRGVMTALDAGASHLLFLDSDCIPPRDAILRLLSHNKPVISGIYYRRSPPHGVPVMLKGGTWYVNYPKNGIFDVDLVGAGCLLLDLKFMKDFPPLDPKIGRHWFSWRVDQASVLPPGEALSEDFSFCTAVRRLGEKVWIDPTVQCRHAGYAQAIPGAMVPLDHNPQT